MDGRDHNGKARAGPPEAAGDLSRLLEEIARTPEQELREAWERGLRPGAVVGRFELLREIGRGGFGVVYEARDRELGRLVAFKAIRPGNRSLAELRQRWLQREAEAAAQLNHPNIVTLHDFGRAEAGPYLILELLRGETLQQRMEAGPVPAQEALRIAISVARALAHAHGCGVVHRDLKPSNVFLCADGAVKVLDFGLAGILTAGAASGGGTPGYMAPEQWRREPEDERTDLFALGVILYAMLTGQLPFEASEAGSAVLEPGPAPAPGGVAEPIAALVARLLEKDASRRPASAHAVLHELEQAAREVRPRLEARRRERVRIALAVAAVALALAVGGALVSRSAREPAPASRLVVAVADFVNETGEPDLDGLSGMLITSLEESRRLSVLTRSRILDFARQSGRDGGRIDEALGKAVAQEVQARALLLATIRRFDSVYAVDLQALDPIRNEYLFTASAQGTGKRSIPGIIDRLSERTRRELSERRSEVESRHVKLAEAVTGDMEAYRHFFLGQQCIDSLSLVQDCAAEFRKAIAIDPDFALAHWMLAYTGDFRGAPIEEQRAAIAEAMRRVDRLPWKEGQLIRAWSAHLDGRQDEALATYRRVIDAFPQDAQAQYLAGDLLFHDNQGTRALPYLERALELGHPAAGVIRSHLVNGLAGAGRADEGLARAREWARSGDVNDVRVLASAASWAGRPQEAVDTLRRVAGSGDPEILLELSSALAGVGAYAEAERIVRGVIAGARAEPLLARAWAHLAILDGYTGKLRAARKHLETGSALEKEPAMRIADAAVWHAIDQDRDAVWRDTQAAIAAAGSEAKVGARFAVLLAYAGDLEHAAQLEKYVTAGSSAADTYRVVLAWRRGDLDGATSIARTSPRPSIAASYLVGSLALDAGKPELAAEFLDRLRVTTEGEGGGLWRSWAYPRSLYLSAIAHERVGQRDVALARVDELLAAWRDADPDAPLLRDARALRERLGRGGSQRQD